MQAVQHSRVTDTSAGLGNLNPRYLTNAELRRYANLVPADKLPAAWTQELINRLQKNPASNKHVRI